MFVFHSTLNVDEFVKSQKINLLSFRRKPESSDFSMFWMPDRACPQLDWGSGMTKSDFLQDHQCWTFDVGRSSLK
jgi:hypothetical protein